MSLTPSWNFGSVGFGHIALPPNAPNLSSHKSSSDCGASGADEESTAGTEDVGRVSVFDAAKAAAPDPILSMRDQYNADPAERKLNLAVGVYRTAEGKPLVLKCVQEAETKLLAEQEAGRAFKEYLPPDGHSKFCDLSLKLLLGDAIDGMLADGRVAAAQSISGTGGLHLAARMLKLLMPDATVHLPAPTWPIHPDIFEAVGLSVAHYPYYDAETGGLDLDGMLAYLRALPHGSVVLMHACAHNPSGVDPTAAQWAQIAAAVRERWLVPMVDAAYQGLATGDLDEDGAGARALAAVPGVEMITVQSYSKNMGLYAERAGVVALLCADRDVASRVQQQLSRTIRLTHSSPPQHGAAICATILGEPERLQAWKREVKGMAERLLEMRAALAASLAKCECPPPTTSKRGSWAHVTEQRGMFTYTGLTPAQVKALRETHHVYMPNDGRISMAGLTTSTCGMLATAIKDVLHAEAKHAFAEPATELPAAKRARSAA